MNPSKQGDLDNFCGIYSLINAVSYLYQDKLKRKPLYLNLMNQFYALHDIQDLINNGMTNIEMDTLIDNVLSKGYYNRRYPINITTPYRCVGRIKISQLFREISLFIDKYKQPRTTVILATQHHWTVIQNIDKEYIYFLDSSGFNKAKKQFFSIVNQQKPYQLCLDDIYFFERTL